MDNIFAMVLLGACMAASAFFGRWLRRRLDRKRALREEAARPVPSRQVLRARKRGGH